MSKLLKKALAFYKIWFTPGTILEMTGSALWVSPGSIPSKKNIVTDIKRSKP
jgi:hypothetical protein